MVLKDDYYESTIAVIKLALFKNHYSIHANNKAPLLLLQVAPRLSSGQVWA
jgi:hypothetical protein